MHEKLQMPQLVAACMLQCQRQQNHAAIDQLIGKSHFECRQSKPASRIRRTLTLNP
jgi:hypothetical protein